MKKFFVSLVAMLAMAVSFVSCSSEDNDVTADMVAGIYAGTASVSVDTGEEDKEPQKVGDYATTATITATNENSVKIAIEGFGSGHYTMPSFEIPICNINSVNEKMALLNGVDFEFDNNGVVYSGSVQGVYTNGDVQLVLLIKPGSMPFAIGVNISLTKK